MTAPARTYFAIRHIPTGNYLNVNRGKRGSTWSEPLDKAPRLFTQHRAATNCLRWWLTGQTARSVEEGSETRGILNAVNYGKLVTTPVPTRRAIDMEIVELQLIIIGEYTNV